MLIGEEHQPGQSRTNPINISYYDKKIIFELVIVFALIGTIQQNCLAQLSNVNYKKLCNQSFVEDFDNKQVSFKTMFIGDWSQSLLYTTYGIDIENKVFINHRDTTYIALRQD